MKLRIEKKTTPLNNYIVATEFHNNGNLGSAILVKISIVIKQTETVKKEINSNEGTLEALKVLIRSLLMILG